MKRKKVKISYDTKWERGQCMGNGCKAKLSEDEVRRGTALCKKCDKEAYDPPKKKPAAYPRSDYEPPIFKTPRAGDR